MHLRLRATRLLLLSVYLSLLGNGVAFAKSKGPAKSRRTEAVSGYKTKKGKHVKAYKRAPAGTSDAKKKPSVR